MAEAKNPETPEQEKAAPAKRSASEALKASDIETIEKEAAAKQAAETLARAESEENLNWGQIATEPPVKVKDEAVEVAGGTKEAVVIFDAFSVIDANGVHNSFVKGDRIKIDEKSYNRGIALGALK